MLVLSKGLGDSAQGFANCILFVFLVPSVRARYRRAVCGCCGKTLARWTATEHYDIELIGGDEVGGDCKVTSCDIPSTECSPDVAASHL